MYGPHRRDAPRPRGAEQSPPPPELGVGVRVGPGGGGGWGRVQHFLLSGVTVRNNVGLGAVVLWRLCCGAVGGRGGGVGIWGVMGQYGDMGGHGGLWGHGRMWGLGAIWGVVGGHGGSWGHGDTGTWHTGWHCSVGWKEEMKHVGGRGTQRDVAALLCHGATGGRCHPIMPRGGGTAIP